MAGAWLRDFERSLEAAGGKGDGLAVLQQEARKIAAQ